MSTPARILMVTGDTSPSAPSAGQILFYAKTDGVFYSKNSSNVETPLGGGGGTVASVNASGGSTGMTFTGGPVTGTGTLTLAGTLGVANGGTGSTTQAGAASAILPDQTGNAGKFLSTNGSLVSWATISGTGTVTSVAIAGDDGVFVSGSPITTAGTITIALNDITPTSVSSSGTVTGSNLSGTNTGDQTITLTGDVTGTGTGSFSATLANSGVTSGVYGSATQVPVFNVDSKGRITSVTNTTITPSAPGGTVTGAIQLRSAGGTFTANDNFYYASSTLNISGTTGIGTISSGGELRISNETTGDDFSVRSGADVNLFANAAGSGFIRLYTNATARITINSAGAVAFNSSFGTAGQVLTSQGSGTPPTWTTIAGGSGTVTSVNATGNNGITVSGGPITTSGSLTFGLGAITPTSVAATGTVTGSNLSGTHTGTSSGTNTGDQTITLTGDVTGSGTGSFAATLSNTGVTAATYGSATQVPVFTVDAKGRISSVTNTTITGGGSSTETVVFKYTSGGSGNLTAGDAIVSESANVNATVTDGANCIVEFSFTGKSAPPTSITIYGQNFTANTFSIVTPPGVGAAQANYKIAGGGTSASPDLANGIFSASNVITLQLRMSDTGASSTIGNRAHALVRFGF
jgi:hypothetical protein